MLGDGRLLSELFVWQCTIFEVTLHQVTILIVWNENYNSNNYLNIFGKELPFSNNIITSR